MGRVLGERKLRRKVYCLVPRFGFCLSSGLVGKVKMKMMMCERQKPSKGEQTEVWR